MSIIDRIKNLIEADKRLGELELERDEDAVNTIKLEQRVRSLESALRRLTTLTSQIAVGGEEVMLLRACIAVLEDESWRG